MKNFLATAAVLFATSTVAIAAPASFVFGAGDIKEGKPATIFTPFSTQYTGVAHYFQDGNSGSVTFSCTLTGKGSDKQVVTARVFPTKNFNIMNPSAILVAGKSANFTWHLTDQKENNGNINIRLESDSTDEGATIQCQGTYSPATN